MVPVTSLLYTPHKHHILIYYNPYAIFCNANITRVTDSLSHKAQTAQGLWAAAVKLPSIVTQLGQQASCTKRVKIICDLKVVESRVNDIIQQARWVQQVHKGSMVANNPAGGEARSLRPCGEEAFLTQPTALLFNMTIQEQVNISESEASNIAKSSMSGGNGHTNYSKNSVNQAVMWNSCEAVLYNAFRELPEIPAPAPGVPSFRLADLGCATGSNTLNAVKSILDMVKSRYAAQNVEMPEVEVFFTDLPSNDFNTLFQELPPLYHGASDSSLKDFSRTSSERIYHARGVPGSFFKEKLFPANSMHVISSFSALHWLSEVPAAITDRASDACNKNRIWLDGTSGAVRAVIGQQSAADLKKFLHLRAQELVAGGVLVLMFCCRLDKDRVRSGRSNLDDGLEEFQGLNETGVPLQQAFRELVSEGVLDQEKLDTFNIPVYSRSEAEVRSAVKESGQFEIHLLDTIMTPDFPAEAKKRMWPTREAFGRRVANSGRALFSGLIRDHIGAELCELVFQRYEVILTKNYDKFSSSRLCMNVAILVRR